MLNQLFGKIALFIICLVLLSLVLISQIEEEIEEGVKEEVNTSFTSEYKRPRRRGKSLKNADIFPNSDDFVDLRLGLLQAIEHMEDKDAQNAMRSLMEELEELDGFSQWIQEEFETLSSMVQTAITRLQNPADCSKAKKLVCHLNQETCGLGCLIHNAAQCLITALATNRVLIISDEPWSYSNYTVMNFFSPISSNCFEFEGPTEKTYEVFPDNSASIIEHVTNFDDIFSHNSRPYDVPARPPVLAETILRLARDPDAWWVGQFVGYIWRPNEDVDQILSEVEKRIDFSSPIVGLHIRRTDKVVEAEPTSIEEYMERVELWFRKYEMSHPPTKRRVYLATDEPKVIEECHEKFPEYDFIANPAISKSVTGGRYQDTEESFIGTIQDIQMLSMTDYVVCTHTSNMCTLVYELLHFKHGDASSMLKSLDIPWWFLYRKLITFEATVEDHSSDLRKGDPLEMDTSFKTAFYTTNHTYVRALNTRTQDIQMYPLYKLKQTPKLYDFPMFDEIN